MFFDVSTSVLQWCVVVCVAVDAAVCVAVYVAALPLATEMPMCFDVVRE